MTDDPAPAPTPEPPASEPTPTLPEQLKMLLEMHESRLNAQDDLLKRITDHFRTVLHIDLEHP